MESWLLGEDSFQIKPVDELSKSCRPKNARSVKPAARLFYGRKLAVPATDVAAAVKPTAVEPTAETTSEA